MKLKNNKWIGLVVFIFLLSCSKDGSGELSTDKKPDDDEQENSMIGKVLPDWEDGYLDIHAINTGRGESTLLIFPDGTTMLVDAAASLIDANEEIPPPAQKPNDNIRPGTAITNYAKHFIKPASNKLDYIMLSHFHPDHMGGYSEDLPMGPGGNFRMGGVTEVGAKVPFDKLLDRGYPDYNYPSDLTSNPRISNYIDFMEWAESEYDATVEQFEVGRDDQVVLQHDQGKYPSFKVQNLVSNGVVWTGTGTDTRNTFPDAVTLVSANAPANIFSIGFVMSYGDFDYFSGGDLQYNGRSSYPWKDIEAPLSSAVSSVEVMKANHHGTSNCNGDMLLGKLKPHTVVAHTWRDVHPNPETVGRMYAADPDCQVFTTNMTNANKSRLAEYLHQMKGTQGHIVVRVKPGGGEYSVYVLDDNNQDYIVKSVYGPYKSK
ncbi:ComEC/Rec2 family competence protein [Albibacterium profundi]|uniref:MBL fold metallo-hydrolase n=1 Tax=Albibacterium profundi TaxID=3134906 RepID=A0ABV5C9M1_9SPHI